MINSSPRLPKFFARGLSQMTRTTTAHMTGRPHQSDKIPRRVLEFLRDPELIFFFVAIRVARAVTRLIPSRIVLTTKHMRAVGLERYARNGQIFYGYQGASYPEAVALGQAMGHIKDIALRYCQGRGLDIGANCWPLPGAHPVDNFPDENAYRLDKWPDGALDFVFSSHCLEHLSRWQTALLLWTSKLKPGGVLFLYLPHTSMTLWKPGSPWVGDDHVWSPTVEAIVPVLEQGGMELVSIDPGPDSYFSFHIVSRKRPLT